MSGITVLVALLFAAPSTTQSSYKKAYQQHQKTGCPLVVLVTADWCPACQQMKSSSIPTAKKNGAFKKVAFVMIDVDENRELATQIMKGGSIPQLVMFYKNGKSSKKVEIIGAASPNTIAKFVNRGLTAPVTRITKREKTK